MFRHVGIVVKDMDESVKFYEELFDFEVVSDYYDDSTYINTILGTKDKNVHMVKLMKGHFMIELLDYDYPKEYYCHVAFTIADSDRMYKKLQARGIGCISPPQPSEHVKVFYCLDPNGFRIELVELL